jgi:hypothetical protein
VRAKHSLEFHTLQEFVDYREQGAVKMAYEFEDVGGRGMGRYWRLIVPESGLLRLQWLEGIKRRAQSMPNSQS